MRQNTCLIVLGMLFAVFFASATPKKYHVHFGVMHCLGTEDFGDDEIYIWRYQDGDYQKPELWWNGASEGEYHHFKSYGSFDSKYEIYVYENDPDLDDEIGYVKIDSNNIHEEFVTMDSLFRGYYTLTWTNLTTHHDRLKSNHDYLNRNKPSYSTMQGYGNSRDETKARQGHKALHNHLNTNSKGNETHKAIVKAVHTFKKTDDADERQQAVDDVKKAIDFSPFRGIIKQIADGKWPTVVLYGPAVAVDFGFTSFNMEYGIALQLDGSKAALVLAFNNDVGITVGDEGKIGVGLNRNEVGGVPGWTYGYTIPADAEITGGITFNYDLALEAPNLQEITYTWSPLSAGASVGYSYTAAKGNFN